MGLDKNGARFLLYCRSLDIDFTRFAMIGRQDLNMSKRDLESEFKSFGSEIDDQQLDSIFNENSGYAEQFLKILGAEEVHSFDKSEYEHATHLHDMNLEIPDEFKDQYTAVLDGGSLEHVFNFPVAMKNCMEMVRVGGHYLGITPANNFLGHGFYQFSPELFFSVFTAENGFEIVKMIAFESTSGGQWYSVKSPREIRGRVTLINSEPVYLLVIARKVARTRVFETTPQQSDYVASWQKGESGSPAAAAKLPLGLDFVSQKIPTYFKALILRVLGRSHAGFDARRFRPMDPTAARRSPDQSTSEGEPDE